MLELKFTYKPDDYKNFNKDSLGIKRIRKIILNLSLAPNIIFSLIFALCFSSALFGRLYFKHWLFDVIVCILTVVTIVIFSLLTLLSQYLLGGNIIIRQQKGINKDISVKIQDDIIVSDNGDMRTEFHWDKIKDIYNKKYNLLIFIADMQSIIIPKRIFNSDEEMNECWNYIQDCYNKAQNKN